MFLEGHIIDFLDDSQLRIGYVRKQERDRLRVVDPRGRNLNVDVDQVVVSHGQSREEDFPALSREIAARIDAHQTEVDVELLWQSLEGNTREFETTELATMFFGDSTPAAVSAVFRKLSEDSLFFKRKGTRFLGKTADQVATERTRRHRESEHEGFRDRVSTALTRLVRNRNADIAPDLAPVLDRLQNWMRHRTKDETGRILEEIVGVPHARDAAYDILLRAGRIDPQRDRFLVIAGIEEQFTPQLLEAANGLEPFAFSTSPANSREDFRGLPAVTIDDEDTLEVDDALTVNYADSAIVVGIHIADVSAFVDPATPLDIEAARRSTTIYLPASTVRMFPERLSTDLASLAEGFDRPAFTVEVRFDEHLNLLNYRLLRSAIHVTKRMSYDEADMLLERGVGIANEWSGPLGTLHRLAENLRNVRAARGAITFRRPELKISVDDGTIQIKKLDPNSPSRLLVSEMMILANGLSADFAAGHAIPVIFRTQEAREPLSPENTVTEHTPSGDALAFERLRKTFKRSRMSLDPGLHSGLGLKAYTQASSPIRRYADLVTQRQLTAVLSGKPAPYHREDLLRVLATAEATELEIRALEDRSTNYWLLEYLSREKVGQPLNAVALDDKGTIELEEFLLRGKVQGTRAMTPGETVRTMIDTVDPVKGEIRFRVIQ
jgi:exoribonuclease-2